VGVEPLASEVAYNFSARFERNGNVVGQENTQTVAQVFVDNSNGSLRKAVGE
jgi:hypothetical protein